MRLIIREHLVLGLAVALVPGIAILCPKPVSSHSSGTHPIASLVLPEKAKAILQRACRDCHSHETAWPWYSRVRPVSMWLQHDVAKAHKRLNFSTWGSDPTHPIPSRNQFLEICDAVSDGSMPPWRYRVMHPNSRLSASDVNTICDLANSPTLSNRDATSQ